VRFTDEDPADPYPFIPLGSEQGIAKLPEFGLFPLRDSDEWVELLAADYWESST